MSRIIAITGGIGSGKTVVSRILSTMGHHVYDCDARAKVLMDNDVDIKSQVYGEILKDSSVPEGPIDRKRLAGVVFADKAMLELLNGIVHDAVKADIRAWAEMQNEDVCWVESAIIYESGIDRMVDEVWEVCAPLELRIERVMKRNGMSRSEVEARIESQRRPSDMVLHSRTRMLVNDGVIPLLPQVTGLLSELNLNN